ncbi:MAG: hypothetical protein M3R67_06310, partial [Acidobacteriota bacterium]|nr:hypothetical protein [Acidobacteriota bacterium]
AEPQDTTDTKPSPRKRAAANPQYQPFGDAAGAAAAGRFARWSFLLLRFLGLRCAPPQALCSRPLRGLKK